MRQLLALTLAACLLPAGPGRCGEKDKGPPRTSLKTAVLKRGPVAVTVRGSGTVEPEEVIVVGAKVGGPVLKFGTDPQDRPIDYGTEVQEGTVLAQRDQTLLRVREQQAQANLERAGAEQKLAEVKLRQAERDWQRAQMLFRQKALTPAEFATARGAHEVAEAAAEVSKAAVKQAEADLREAQLNLGFTTITSPVKGVVVDRRVNVGQPVTPGPAAASLFLIARDLKKLRVWAQVRQADVGKIWTDKAVRVTAAAFPGRDFAGKVIFQGKYAARPTPGAREKPGFYTVV